jgi:hypothetical protein
MNPVLSEDSAGSSPMKVPDSADPVEHRERLGGLLSHYQRRDAERHERRSRDAGLPDQEAPSLRQVPRTPRR